VGAREADGPLGVLQRGGVAVARGVAVLEDDAGGAERVEPAGDGVALVVHRQVAVAAARADHHRPPRRLLPRRQGDGHGWGVGGGVLAGRPRRAARPEDVGFRPVVRGRFLVAGRGRLGGEQGRNECGKGGTRTAHRYTLGGSGWGAKPGRLYARRGGRGGSG